MCDTTFGLTEWHTDEDGILKISAADESYEMLAQLTTSGVNIYYELAEEQVSDIQYNGLFDVGDFGDMKFEGVSYYYVMGNIEFPLEPSVVVTKYGINYRDTIRGLANSGVTFGTYGVKTSALYKSSEVSNVNLNGTLTLSAGDIKKMMMFTLAGVTNTIVLPNLSTLGTNAFSCQCKIVQGATGSRGLTFVMDDGNGGTTNIKNTSEVDFSSGSANQSCIATLLYDGNGSWWIEATSFVD